MNMKNGSGGRRSFLLTLGRRRRRGRGGIILQGIPQTPPTAATGAVCRPSPSSPHVGTPTSRRAAAAASSLSSQSLTTRLPPAVLHPVLLLLGKPPVHLEGRRRGHVKLPTHQTFYNPPPVKQHRETGTVIHRSRSLCVFAQHLRCFRHRCPEDFPRGLLESFPVSLLRPRADLLDSPVRPYLLRQQPTETFVKPLSHLSVIENVKNPIRTKEKKEVLGRI
mmetsp:Transcript_8557/g.16792  ORF Transcript_8557/g.16792 Transcript_8557/m.16792 type:complete len:221 (+) Transcript_8557:346-1008(+)